MLGEITAANRYLDGEERVHNIVLMGSGEPLDNYDNVMKFLRLLREPDGLCISLRSVSLSTCGLVPKMYDLANEDLPVTLSVSLHAPNDEIRRQTMPIAKVYPMDDLLAACRNYIDKTGRRVIFEYALVGGVNCEERHAIELASRLRGANHPPEVDAKTYTGPAWLGIDAGSTTTKLALITADGGLLYTYYHSNEGNPVAIVLEQLKEIYALCAGRIQIKGAAVTGYGEDLIKNAFSCDLGLVETMAHYKAAAHFQPDVDFIIDIGGQDMKCFKIRNGPGLYHRRLLQAGAVHQKAGEPGLPVYRVYELQREAGPKGRGQRGGHLRRPVHLHCEKRHL